MAGSGRTWNKEIPKNSLYWNGNFKKIYKLELSDDDENVEKNNK